LGSSNVWPKTSAMSKYKYGANRHPFRTLQCSSKAAPGTLLSDTDATTS
jgi:hypothetical protein